MPANYSSPSQSPFGGFGFSGGWVGSGVWAPNGAGGGGGTSPVGAHSLQVSPLDAYINSTSLHKSTAHADLLFVGLNLVVK